MADSEQLQKLLEGVDEWNRWRANNPDTRIDLRSADLRDVELPGVNLRDAFLAGCNFRDAILDRADLTSARLDNIILQGARIPYAILVNAVAPSANLLGVVAHDADFDQADFSGARAVEADFSGANFNKAIFKDARMQLCEFRLANLSRTDFRDADLTKAQFVQAFVEGADFRRCALANANFDSARLRFARFRGADVQNISLVGALIARADFRQSRGLTCDQLHQTTDWPSAYRDEDLACGADIPHPSPSAETESVRGQEFESKDKGHDYADAERNSGSVAIESLPRIRNVVDERPALVELSQLIIEQSRINIAALRAVRLNSPEAEAVIEGLERTLKMAQEIREGLEQDEPPENTEDRISQLLSSLLDALEKYVTSDRAIRTAVAGIAVIASALCGVTPVAQAILAASAVGDPGVLNKARDLIKDWKGENSSTSSTC